MNELSNDNRTATNQAKQRQELVAQHSGDVVAPLSLPELANTLAGAVAGMDDVYADVTVTQTEESRITKFSFRAYKHRKQP